MTDENSDQKVIMIVDDDPAMCKACASILEPRGYRTVGANSGQEALSIIQSNQEPAVDLVLSDIRMPGMSGIRLLDAIQAYDSTIPVVIMTGYGSIDSAVEVMKLGAMDYITKPFEKSRILEAVERAIAMKNLRTRVRNMETEHGMDAGSAQFLGDSAKALGIREQIDVASRNTCNILLAGPSGTGKELIARSIHRQSARSKGPFIPVNCGAIPASLVESEFFGHMKGAFTNASRTKDGLFQVAHKGILFLDEITEMPLDLQVKLLRVIEDGKVRRVGATNETEVDVQLIAATNRNVQAALKEDRLRMDLFYRLSVMTIQIPPLWERKDDIPMLVDHFIETLNVVSDHRISGVDQKALEILKRYKWPGNVRELQNVIQSIFVQAASTKIRTTDLPDHIAKSSNEKILRTNLQQTEDILSLCQVEEEHIRRTLKMADGNRTLAAKILGISRSALYNKIQEYNIK